MVRRENALTSALAIVCETRTATALASAGEPSRSPSVEDLMDLVHVKERSPGPSVLYSQN